MDKETIFNKLKVLVKERSDNIQKEISDLEKEYIFIQKEEASKSIHFKAYKGDFITLHLEVSGKVIYLLSKDFDTSTDTQRHFYISIGINDQEQKIAFMGPDYLHTLGTIGQRYYYALSTPDEIEVLMSSLIEFYKRK